MSGHHDDPVALVSGGSRGIGRAVVRGLAADGWRVAFCYQAREDAAEECVAEVERLGSSAFATLVDVAAPDKVKAWIDATEREIGPIGAVVTSAGVVRDNGLLRMSSDEWHSVLDTNLSGVFNVCRSAVFPMLKRRSGSIVNLSSIAGIHGNSGQANYAAAKAGIIGFTKSWPRRPAGSASARTSSRPGSSTPT